jgi:hypothetical protein
MGFVHRPKHVHRRAKELYLRVALTDLPQLGA